MKTEIPRGTNEEIIDIVNKLFPWIGHYPDENSNGNLLLTGRSYDITALVKTLTVLKRIEDVEINEGGTGVVIKIKEDKH